MRKSFQIILWFVIAFAIVYTLQGCSTLRLSTPVLNLDWTNSTCDTTFQWKSQTYIYIQSTANQDWLTQYAPKK